MTQVDTFPPAPTTARRSGPWHRRVGGLHVLKVQGNFYDMGHQHGSLLREAVPQGPLPYYRTYLERLLGGSIVGPLAPLVWPAVQALVGRRVARALPGFARETLRGLADGSGVSLAELTGGATMPDSLVWVMAKLMRWRRIAPALEHRATLGLGCTSALAWGDATRDGKLLHARNFDFHGVASWPRTAAVVFHEPEDGMRYVSVAAAGVPLGGGTAMNEAGLTLTVHQHMFTDRAALGGTPIGLVGDVVMRTATNLDEAQAVLARHRPIGCWTYLVADGKRREVLCWEENPERHFAHRYGTETGTLGYTNIYFDAELGRTEKELYGSYWRHNRGRLQRVRALLAERRGDLDPTAMAGVLADTGGTACRLHQAVAMLMTVGSVVFQPEDGLVWVGTGEAPTSHGAFLAFDLRREDHAPEVAELRVGPGAADPGRAAFDAYRRAYLAYLDARDVVASRALMDEACRLAPAQALYHHVAGLLALRTGDHAAALASFDRARSLGHPDAERRSTFELWRGRAADLLGRREEALAGYRAALAGKADAPVHAAARAGLSKPYAARRTARIHVDFAFGDVAMP